MLPLSSEDQQFDRWDLEGEKGHQARAEEHGRLIRRKRLELGLKRPAFADEVEKRGQKMTPDYLNKLEAGTRHLSNASPELRNAIREVLGFSRDQWEQKTGLYTPDQSRLEQRSQRRSNAVPVSVIALPVRTLAAAGSAFYTDGAVVGEELVSTVQHRPDMLVVGVCGDSMRPTLKDGDRAYVDTHDRDPTPGKVYLIHIHGDGYVLKRVKQVGARWLLMSDNPEFDALEPDQADILGRVYYHQPKGSEM